MDWESGVSRCELVYREWINKVLLYSTGNYIQYPVINHNGKECEKECRDFPGGAVVKNPHFHYKGHRFDPWLGN